MLIVFIRALILYFVIILSVRLMGKRQIGELQPSELVVTILLSNIATLPVEDINIPMSMGIVPIFTLVSIDVIVSCLSLKFKGLRTAISGSAKIIISNGRIDQRVLKELRFSADDLMASLRNVEVFDIEEVQLAVVETTGKISVCRKKTLSPPTCEDMGIKVQNSDPPVMVINNGSVSFEALSFLGLDKKWLDKVLGENGVGEKGVYIMSAQSRDKYTIIKKDQK